MLTLQRKLIFALLGVLSMYSLAVAEEPTNPSPDWLKLDRVMAAADADAGGAASSVAGEPAGAGGGASAYPRLVPWVDYTGDLWHRAALTGDWGGVRQQLMDKGLRFDLSFIQVYQGNWAGGTEYWDPYQGNVRYGLRLDTGHAGLWPGGMLVIRGETRYGQSDMFSTGALLPVDTLSLYPKPGDDVTAVMDLYYMQFLSEWFGVLVGKMSPRDTNVFASDEVRQFMNAGLVFNPVLGTTLPLDFLTVGAIFRPTEWFMVTTIVLDSDGTATVSGFDTAFERGTTVYQIAELGVEPFGLPGHQRVGWTHSDKSRIQFEQTERDIIGSIITGSTAGLKRKDNDWSLFYDFDQYVYTVPGKKDQGIGLFGRFGVTSGEVNPIQSFYSIGVGGKGMIPTRDNDSFGIGYYYLDLSNKLPELIQRHSEDEKGIEIFYNIAVTPWLHITPDLQIIDPARSNVDTTVVAGVRVVMDF